jgi:hypothetical protein
MSRLFVLLLLRWVRAEECANKAAAERNTSASLPWGKLRQPRAEPVLADIVGLEEAKQVLREAIILPSSMPVNEMRLFWRSSLRSGVLLCGSSGLSNEVVEAAAAASGALILSIPSTEVASSNFCQVAIEAVVSEQQPVVVIIESLDDAPAAALSVQQCLREAAGSDASFRLFVVATLARNRSALSATMLAPFGYVVEMGLPSEAERKQFLLNLLKQVSRVEPMWGGALNQAAVSALANLTESYTFSEIELVVRRAFVRSSNAEGSRDPVALHHFEQILAAMPPQASAVVAGPDVLSVDISQATAGEPGKSSPEKNSKKKDMKDPMDGIFGWCNFWLPEALHLPPVVWAMIIFGVLAHFMARSTYPPYGGNRRKNRSRSSWPEAGQFGSSSFMNNFGGDDSFSNLYGHIGGNMPAPPGMNNMRPPDFMPGGLDGGSRSSESTTAPSSAFPTAGEPSIGRPPSPS